MGHNIHFFESIKKVLMIPLIIIVVVGAGVWILLNPGPEHIEDTNGPDNYSLQQITHSDVTECKMGSRGGISNSKVRWDFGVFAVSNGIKYSSKEFTGVYRLHTSTYFKGSDIHVYLPQFEVISGNFAFYVVLDGEIVGELKPDEFGTAEFIMKDISKTADVEYIIAGESANFKFAAPETW